MNNEIYKDAPSDINQLRAELKDSGHTFQEFQRALTTISITTIFYWLFEVRQYAQKLEPIFRSDSRCNRRGFKMELKAVMTQVEFYYRKFSELISKDQERIEIMAHETHPYYADQYRLMEYAVTNHLHRIGIGDDVKLLSPLVILAALVDMCNETINERVAEMLKFRLTGAIRLEAYQPDGLAEAIDLLAQKLEQYNGIGHSDIKLDEMQSLAVGMAAIKNQMFDIDLMELHAAFGLEQVHSERWLKDNAAQSHKLLHIR